MKIYDVCIIGGGAAGLITAASLNNKIKKCIIEKNKTLGRKLAATGGGRCNITNEACGGKEIVLDFFKSAGLETYADSEGRYYPYSNQASDVVKILSDKAKLSDTEILSEMTVEKVECKGDYFLIKCSGERNVKAKKVVMASGGKSAPQLGTTGDGYKLLEKLGHTINKLYPVLAGIECGNFKDIKGVRAKGTVTLLKDGAVVASENGEIQFTEDGISGICVFNLTLYITSENGENFIEALKRYKVKVDLAPDFSAEEIAKRESSFGILSQKLAARVAPDMMKNWELPVLGVKGWKVAQCTGGGADLNEIDMETMESKIVSGLYITGELLDYQGPCGGFNLQNAWETGIKAANEINRIFK